MKKKKTKNEQFSSRVENSLAFGKFCQLENRGKNKLNCQRQIKCKHSHLKKTIALITLVVSINRCKIFINIEMDDSNVLIVQIFRGISALRPSRI